MLNLEYRYSTFGDIRTYRRRKSVVKPRKVALIAPHSNENPAAVPFLKALAKRVKDEGIQTETHIIRDKVKLGWEFSRKLGSGRRLRYDDKKIIDDVCNLEDVLRRARLITAALDQCSVVAEVHALTGNFMDEDLFFEAAEVHRIKGTRICLIRKENKLDVFDPFKYHFSSKEKTVAKDRSKLKGFDLDKSLEELKRLYRKIKAKDNHIFMIELPSVAHRIPERHPMFFYYFTIPNFHYDYCINSNATAFETQYLAYMYKSIGFSPKDIEAVASVILGI